MSTSVSKQKQSNRTAEFLANICGMTRKDFEKLGKLPETHPKEPSTNVLKMPGVMAPNNQPEFWADAPWRLIPGVQEIPITFYIRDGNVDSPGFSPWRLDSLRVEQRLRNKKWHKLRTYLPANLGNIDQQGQIEDNFWVFSSSIPLSELHDVRIGDKVHLRVIFVGSANPYDKITLIKRHLEITLSQYPFPLGRTAQPSGPRQWFYGDPHYHSAYTNDVKEYGAPLPETRGAALSIGLDWIVVTDHSCDLVLKRDGESGLSRWDLLKAEISSGLSDECFRFILGEEITLIGRGEKYVHMLAMGGMQDMIQGAFLPDDSSSLPVDIWINAIKTIIRFGKGYSLDLLQTLFGKLLPFNEVLGNLPTNTLTFAAHPYDIAQVPPSKWDGHDLSHLQLTGHEFWNARSRRSANHTDNPFTRKSWTDPDTLRHKDEVRVNKLLSHVSKKWEPHLIRGVDEWAAGSDLPSRRPVFIGGSDSHGDFNYHAGMAWNYSKADMVDDNAPGRVRTAIYLPGYQSALVPDIDLILAALKKGSCVVTDGPILEFSLQQNGQFAYMGETLQISGEGDPEIKIIAHSTPEFGMVTQVEVVTYFKSQKSKKSSSLIVEQGKQASIPIAGNLGYYRLQAQTSGADGELFCCFTNPIWVRVVDGPKRKLKIEFT
ncbi:MAG: hypothetical protein EHM41_12045 [Chloroflexi bacterium]|nr:MAG: hypothetical protein EHM41_12045 [Chloroflexota bacterium]